MKKADNKLLNKKAAGYIRVSTVYQVDKDSLPMQREDLTNYIKYALGIEEYEIFKDAGYSAKNTDRPAFQRMMSRLRTGEFSHLVVWKIDRISRNLIDFATMYEELKQLGVTFVSKNEQFDTSSAMGEAMLKIILVFAELERKMTSERVSAVMISRANEGKFNGGRIPFGYNYNKISKKLSIDDKEAAIVRLIYDKYDEYKSLVKVVKYLNSKGYKTKRGSSFSPAGVYKILTSPFYVGDYIYNIHDERNTGNSSTKNRRDEEDWVIVRDHHPAIIDHTTQEITKAELKSRNLSNVSYKTYQRKNTHIFSGLLECGMCGANMVATIDKPRADGSRPSIYMCGTRRKSKTCTNKFISDKKLGPFVFNLMSNIIKAYNNVGESTTVETLEKKLLRGEAMSEVAGIEHEGVKSLLESIYNAYENKSDIILSQPPTAFSSNAEEWEILRSEKKKYENAALRLRQLFLYGSDTISEQEYIEQRKNINDNIALIDMRLKEIDRQVEQNFIMSDSEFFTKVYLFLINSNLASARNVNFDRLVSQIDKQVLKKFINQVIQKVVILDGKIAQITLKNDITLKFLYIEK